MKCERKDCPEKQEIEPFGPIKCVNRDIGIASVSFIVAFTVWVIASIYTVQAKADRVIAVEEKVDYIYRYLVEKNK